MLALTTIWRYLRGCVFLASGQDDAIKSFNLSADGFYQSFQAVLFALPIMALSWISLSGSEQLAARAGVGPNLIFIYAGFIELLTWFVPLVVMFLAANLLGIADKISAYIITANWTNLLFTLISWPPAVNNMIRGIDPMEATSSYQLTLFIVALIFSWRLQHAVLGRGALFTTGIFLLTLLTAFIVLIFSQRLLLGL